MWPLFRLLLPWLIPAFFSCVFFTGLLQALCPCHKYLANDYLGLTLQLMTWFQQPLLIGAVDLLTLKLLSGLDKFYNPKHNNCADPGKFRM